MADPEQPKETPQFFSWCGEDDTDPDFSLIGICIARETAAKLRYVSLDGKDSQAISLQADITEHLEHIAQRKPAGTRVRLLIVISDAYDELRAEVKKNAERDSAIPFHILVRGATVLH